MTASALENERATLRIVSRKGHSQAVSMCALATACSRGALGEFGVSNTGLRAATTSAQGSVVDRSSMMSQAFQRASRPRAGSGSSLVKAMASARSLAAVSAVRLMRTSCARDTVIRGAAFGIGPNEESVGYQSKVGMGFAAPSRYTSMVRSGQGMRGRPGLKASTTWPSASKIMASPVFGPQVQPRSRSRSTSDAGHSCGTVPVRRNQVVVHGAPHVVPLPACVYVAAFAWAKGIGSGVGSAIARSSLCQPR